MLRSILTTAAAMAVLAVVVGASLMVGSMALTPAQVADALLGRGDPIASMLVLELRLPRTILGALCGAAVGAAAGALRVLTPVRLPDASLLGITPIAVLPCLLVGASGLLSAAAAGSEALGILLLFVLGIGGAALAAAVVLAAARWLAGGGASAGTGSADGAGPADGTGPADGSVRMLLARVGGPVLVVAGVLVLAIVIALWAVLGGASVLADGHVLRWNGLGMLVGAGRPLAIAAAVPVVLGILLCAGAAVIARLTASSAAPIPSRPHFAAVIVGGVGIALCAGTAAALAGGLAFAGLLAIVLARLLAGRGPVGPTIAAIPLGAIVVLLADMAGRIVAVPAEIPVGTVLLAVGAPAAIVVGLVRLVGLLLRRGAVPHQVVIMRNNA